MVYDGDHVRLGQILVPWIYCLVLVSRLATLQDWPLTSHDSRPWTCQGGWSWKCKGKHGRICQTRRKNARIVFRVLWDVSNTAPFFNYFRLHDQSVISDVPIEGLTLKINHEKIGSKSGRTCVVWFWYNINLNWIVGENLPKLFDQSEWRNQQRCGKM